MIQNVTTLQDQSFLGVQAKSLKKILWSCLSSVSLRITNGLHTVWRVKPFSRSPAESRLKTGSIWACTSPVPSPHPSRKKHCSTGAGPHMCRQPLGHGVLSVNQKPPDWKKKKKNATGPETDKLPFLPCYFLLYMHVFVGFCRFRRSRWRWEMPQTREFHLERFMQRQRSVASFFSSNRAEVPLANVWIVFGDQLKSCWMS